MCVHIYICIYIYIWIHVYVYMCITGLFRGPSDPGCACSAFRDLRKPDRVSAG